MPRIKKQGLDYFPLNTDFIHDRLVRRIMKREGDASLSVLIEVRKAKRPISIRAKVIMCVPTRFSTKICRPIYTRKPVMISGALSP